MSEYCFFLPHCQLESARWPPENRLPRTVAESGKEQRENGSPGARAFKVAGDIHRLSLSQTSLFHVLGIHENDPAPVVDSTIAIIQSVNRRVELVVGSNGHQEILSSFDQRALDLVDCKIGLAGSG